MSDTWTASETDHRAGFYMVPRGPCLLSEAWGEDEDQAVRTLYPDYAAVCRRLPHRTLGAIKHRAARMGIRKQRHVWTQIEVARLKRLWSQRRPTDEHLRASFPGLTLDQIISKATHVGLVRERPAPKILGVPVLDAIRQRAHDEGMTMRDLDVVSGTRRYFQQTNRQVVWKHVAAGAEALGGRLVPSWDEDAEPARDELVMGYRPAALRLAA